MLNTIILTLQVAFVICEAPDDSEWLVGADQIASVCNHPTDRSSEDGGLSPSIVLNTPVEWVDNSRRSADFDLNSISDWEPNPPP